MKVHGQCPAMHTIHEAMRTIHDDVHTTRRENVRNGLGTTSITLCKPPNGAFIWYGMTCYGLPGMLHNSFCRCPTKMFQNRPLAYAETGGHDPHGAGSISKSKHTSGWRGGAYNVTQTSSLLCPSPVPIPLGCSQLLMPFSVPQYSSRPHLHLSYS